VLGTIRFCCAQVGTRVGVERQRPMRRGTLVEVHVRGAGDCEKGNVLVMVVLRVGRGYSRLQCVRTSCEPVRPLVAKHAPSGTGSERGAPHIHTFTTQGSSHCTSSHRPASLSPSKFTRLPVAVHRSLTTLPAASMRVCMLCTDAATLNATTSPSCSTHVRRRSAVAGEYSRVRVHLNSLVPAPNSVSVILSQQDPL